MKTFTVFTPTFNRAHTLHRVFDSLMQQTFNDFEWLIVDDGSTDDTKTQIQKWQAEASFAIRYYYQTNQGKHIAFNKGVQEAKGRFFVPLDSDDACKPKSLAGFLALWNDIPEADRDAFSGVCVLCEDQKGNIIGDHFPKPKLDTNSCEVYYKYRVKGEKWGFHRTEILKQFPFPEVQGVKFIPECIIWHNIAKKYNIRCVNESLRIYYIEAIETKPKPNPKAEEETETEKALQTVSLTNSTTTFSTKKARSIYYEWVLNHDIAWFFYSPLTFLKYAFQFVRYSSYVNTSIFDVKPWFSKGLICLIYFPAYLFTQFEKIYARS